MKTTKTLTYVALSALMAACSVHNPEVPTEKEDQAKSEVALDFDAYTSRGIDTKAGQVDDLTTAQLRLNTAGFGVFGYYTNGELYSESARPDFMYNTWVYDETPTASKAKWVYSPIKYWPNEFGRNAISEDVDRTTFFAYAPYVKVTPSTGLPLEGDMEKGIIALSRNTATGDPLVKYVSNFTPGQGVDLCWGVAKEAFTDNVSAEAFNNVAVGEPFLNLAKPKVSSKIKFDFRHALSQLNVQIDADVDKVHDHADALDDFSRIYVRSVTFEGFTASGTLNLNASATNGPIWYDISGSSRLAADPVVIYDGRRDGKEANAAAPNELPFDLNPEIIQSAGYTTTLATDTTFPYTALTSTTTGVTNTAQNLFNSTAADDYILVIPTSEPLKITIVYDVETADATLPGYLSDGQTHGSAIENAITQTIAPALTMEAGKKYLLKIHLGMTSAKFEATTALWTNGTDSETDLPVNAD
ncbi:MAG: fimbrillin family protein [Bacteroidales bacterium]|nr:fimbrillin family protein [Bacteroidales bacterium]